MYLYIENEKINGAGQVECVNDNIQNIEVSEDVYNAYSEDTLRYIWDGENVIENPDYEEVKRQQERAELDRLTLTPSDVERALYRAKQMDFEDLKALITEEIPSIDIKGLSIEFRAKDFYRGAMANGMRLFDIVGDLLGYTPDDMDYLFENKQLPSKDTEEAQDDNTTVDGNAVD